MINVREIAYVNWNIQPQPYPFSSVLDGKFRSIKCTWYDNEKKYKYGKTVKYEMPTPSFVTIESIRETEDKESVKETEAKESVEVKRASRGYKYYPFYNVQPYDEDLQEVPHICERIIYTLQTDDEEWERKRRYYVDQAPHSSESWHPE